VENTPTIVLVSTERPEAKSCARIGLALTCKAAHWRSKAPFSYLSGIEIGASLRKTEGLSEALFIPVAAA
jgi:hypothetical protein